MSNEESTTASEKVFMIPELTSMICNFSKVAQHEDPDDVSQPELVALAQVNKLLSDIALNVLWNGFDNMEAFEHLRDLYCEKPDNKGDEPRIRNGDVNALQVILGYMSRVRKLESQEVYANRASISIETILETLPVSDLTTYRGRDRELSDPASHPLFPNVVDLQVHSGFTTEENIIFETLFLGPNLRKLHLIELNPEASGALNTFLPSLKPLFPLITALKVSGKQLTAATNGLLQLLGEGNNLQLLGAVIAPESWLQVLTKGAFPHLTTLELISSVLLSKNDTTNLFQTVSTLVSSGSLSELRRFILRDVKQETSMSLSVKLGYQDLEPLLAHSDRWKMLDINTAGYIALSDAELEKVGRRLGSAIEKLVLNPSPLPFPNTEPYQLPLATLDGVAAVLKSCPKLVYLGLLINALEPPTLEASSSSNSVISTKLNSFFFGQSTASRKAGTQVGEQLLRWCPNLRDLSWTRANHKWDYWGDNYYSRYAHYDSGWKKAVLVVDPHIGDDDDYWEYYTASDSEDAGEGEGSDE